MNISKNINKGEIVYQEIISDNSLLFKKKINKLITKPKYKYIKSDTGRIKHFTPAAQEWHNSIYAYNSNYIKLLPIADKNLFSLLKSYFNFQLKDKLPNKRNRKRARARIRYRRLSVNKIFVGKGDLKHTSNKVIITLFVYNVEKKILNLNLQKVKRNLLYPSLKLKKFVNLDTKSNEIITYSRLFSIEELKRWRNWHNLYVFYYSYITKLVNKFTLYIAIISKYYKALSKLVEIKVLTENERFSLFNDKVDHIHSIKYPNFHLFILGVMHRYKKTLRRFRYLVSFNKTKFRKNFIWELSHLVQNIYNKEIEFNVVNLKKMQLNSDIFTQAVSLKLKNRDNRLFRVLRSSLARIKLPNVKRMSRIIKSNKDKYLINKIRNNKINSMINFSPEKDSLNNLLLDFYPSVSNLKIKIKKVSRIVRYYISLENYVLMFLKHRKMAGIRIEAKGRLTRRFTASRSVFKMRWKGGLKNIDSSFRGLSAIMLRGYVKSNVEYSMLNSKNRNGAFGVKGWIANK